MTEARVMLITGTRKGIGRYLAEYYSRQGIHVVGCSRGDIDFSLENYRHYCADVYDEEKAKTIFRDIRREYGRLDVLINNAGIASMNHTLLTPMKKTIDILNTNFVGSFLFSREAAKVMKNKRFGRIINFSTVATRFKLEGEAIYAASKAAVLSFTEILARELGEFGITVNVVGPTPLKTDLTRSVPEDKMEALLKRQAIPRFSEYRDVANVIDFFCSPDSDFVTGQAIYLGGG